MDYPATSAYETLGGFAYLPRMLEKIRLHAAGRLGPDYIAFLGKGFDGRLCDYLRLSYDELRDFVLERQATDQQALDWILQRCRPLTPIDLTVWNGFATKRGWRDADGGSEFLERAKNDHGLAGRDDIQTMFDFYDVDEGRRS